MEGEAFNRFRARSRINRFDAGVSTALRALFLGPEVVVVASTASVDELFTETAVVVVGPAWDGRIARAHIVVLLADIDTALSLTGGLGQEIVLVASAATVAEQATFVDRRVVVPARNHGVAGASILFDFTTPTYGTLALALFSCRKVIGIASTAPVDEAFAASGLAVEGPAWNSRLAGATLRL